MSSSRHLSPVSKEVVGSDKTPVTIEDVEGSFKKNPSWRFSSADTDHPRWSVMASHEDIVQDDNDPTETKIIHIFSQSIDRELLEALKSRETTTWSELLTQTGGRSGGTNSHNIPIYQLTKEAQDRAAELGVMQDVLLSLRIDGRKRVYGILESGVMSIVWFDRDHEICPSSKR